MKCFHSEMLKFFVRLFVVATFVLSAVPAVPAEAAPNAGEGWPMHLRLLSGPNGGQWFFMGESLAEVLSSRLLPTTSRIGGGVDNIGSINQKAGDIAFTLNCFLGAAGSGEQEYSSIRLENAEILANIYPQVLYVLLRKDFAEKNGIDGMETLIQKKLPLRFASLKPGTASEFILRLLLKYGYHTDFEALEKQGWNISFNNYAEIADNLVAGELDCFAYTAGTDVPLIHTIEEHTDVVILPIDSKILKELTEKFRTNTYTIPAGTYKSTKSSVDTLGDYTCLIVRKDLPEDLIYTLSKTLWENKGTVANKVSDFGGLDPQTAVPVGLPVHPGALRFWNELLSSGKSAK